MESRYTHLLELESFKLFDRVTADPEAKTMVEVRRLPTPDGSVHLLVLAKEDVTVTLEHRG